MTFTKAIVRRPGASFSDGLTTARLGAPLFEKTLQQHDAYVRALQACGLEVAVLEADERHPDSTFVEDTAGLAGRTPILARPGAPSRPREVAPIRGAPPEPFNAVESIEELGKLVGREPC